MDLVNKREHTEQDLVSGPVGIGVFRNADRKLLVDPMVLAADDQNLLQKVLVVGKFLYEIHRPPDRPRNLIPCDQFVDLIDPVQNGMRITCRHLLKI